MGWTRASVVLVASLVGCNCDDGRPGAHDASAARLAVALVVDGHPLYYGNDEYSLRRDCTRPPGDPPPSAVGSPCKMDRWSPGLYRSLYRALDRHRLDGVAVVIVNEDHPRVAYDGALADLRGASLPEQRAQEHALVMHDGYDALQLAADRLHTVTANRKVIVIVTSATSLGDLPTPLRLAITRDHVEVATVAIPADCDDCQSAAQQARTHQLLRWSTVAYPPSHRLSPEQALDRIFAQLATVAPLSAPPR